jgi:altronate dehydratase large subunit
VEVSKLNLAVECGGTDSTSGILTNPAIGFVSDKLIGEYKGRVIMTEITEMIGAEHLLASRAVNDNIKTKIIKAVEDLEQYSASLGVDLRNANPVPDNIKGGITTIEEKSIGAILKGGTGPVHGFLEYGEGAAESGLYVMNSTPPAVESMTAMAAGGAQIILFSTGQGNTICNPIVPTLKITSNPETANRMQLNIDIDLSADLKDVFDLFEVGNKLWNSIIEYANGKLSKGEVTKEEEAGISRIGLVI